jgi:tetratricopeptide (TPR) repeat protein
MLGRYEDGSAALRRALELLTEDVHAPERVRVRRRLGEVYVDWGRRDKAAPVLAQALEEAEALQATAADDHARAQVLVAIGRLRDRQSSPVEADAAYEAALDILDALVDDDSANPEYRYDLARCCHRLFKLRDQRAGADAAPELLKRAMMLARGLRSEYRDDPRFASLDGAIYETFMWSGEELSVDPEESRPGVDHGDEPTDIGPDWMPFLAASAPVHARGAEPYFVIQTHQGTSNVLGRFEAEAWIYLFRTVEGAKGTTRCVLTDGDGNRLVVQFFGEQDLETDDFLGSFVILEGTGRLQGAVGEGRHQVIHRTKGGIELRMEGRIRRE